jgi:hypothetical protein
MPTLPLLPLPLLPMPTLPMVMGVMLTNLCRCLNYGRDLPFTYPHTLLLTRAKALGLMHSLPLPTVAILLACNCKKHPITSENMTQSLKQYITQLPRKTLEVIHPSTRL